MRYVVVNKLPEGKTLKKYYGGIVSDRVLWVESPRLARTFSLESTAQATATLIRKAEEGSIAFVEPAPEEAPKED